MALITGTLAIAASSSSILTLNRVELAGLITDTFYTNKDNWKKVVVRWANLSQFVDVVFDGQTGLGKCAFPAKVLNGNFKIYSIKILDYVNGEYTMTQGQVPSVVTYNITASGGVAYSGGGGGGSALLWDNLAAGMVTNGNGELHNTTPDAGWGNNAYSESGKFIGSGDFSFTWNMSMADLACQWIIGIQDSTPNLASAAYNTQLYGVYHDANQHYYAALGGSYYGVDLGIISGLTSAVKIARESGNLKFYVNNVLLHTINSVSNTTIYPTANLYNGSNNPAIQVSISSASKT